jgi:hypothetical protein
MRLEVEGAEVPMASVWVHHQRDPYPGGLRYRLSVPMSMAAPWIGRLPGRGDVDEDGARRGLTAIAGMLSWARYEDAGGGHAQEVRLTHVLNTIDTVEESEARYTIGGICSPFLGAGMAEPCDGPESRLE